MSQSRAVPRINGRSIPDYTGQVVSIVGRVLSSNDVVTTIQASDSQQVRVNTGSTGFPLPQKTIVEFVGVVRPDASVDENWRLELSDNFNLEAYDAVVRKMHSLQLRHIYSS